jgi:TolB-like protein/DNA-binding winged helix-turn-helix (wHTH) protein/Tfp pilus assembly protein PilF
MARGFPEIVNGAGISQILLDAVMEDSYNPHQREAVTEDRKPARRTVARFGVFEFDTETGELRREGLPVRLAPQPAQVLALLLEHPGDLVTREQIYREVWGSGTFVDFEQGVTHCIKQIRTALGDDADSPRYVQTVHRRGYRFIAPVEDVIPEREPVAMPPPTPPPRWKWRWGALAAAALALAALVLVWDWVRQALRGPPPRIESIAVLPLVNLSGEASQEYFADGMTEELITELGKVPGLRVISRTSVMRYKGTTKPVPQIGRELNVDAIIEGTVTQSAGRVRLTANLLHAATDRHLWAQTFDRELGDMLELRREMACIVARQVRAALPAEDATQRAAARPLNPEAYDLYLKGQYHYYKWSVPEFQKAVSYFERAIAVDPNFVEAYLGLAKTYGWQWIMGVLPPNEAYPKFTAAMQKALSIDGSVPEAHYVKAAAAYYFYWNWAEAEKEFRLALQKNPNLEEARFEYAWFLAAMGRHAEAVPEAQRAVEVDPFSVSANLALGSVYQMAGRPDEALRQIEKTIEIDPNDPRCYMFLREVYKSLGLRDEEVKAYARVLELSGQSDETVESMRKAYREEGYAGYLRWSLRRARHPYDMAALQAQLGMKDEAFANLEKAYQEHWWAMVRLKSCVEWVPLHGDPRYEALLRRMNFPP